MRTTKVLLIMLLNLLLQHSLFAQNQMNYWYFGEKAGINFNTTPPTILTNSSMDCWEGSATISDKNGNLLFYTNGGPFAGWDYSGAVWNRNGAVMPNGDLSAASTCNSSAQGPLIVPDPADNQGYYIFTTDCQENSMAGGFRYHYVDMSLDAGNGDVVSKNTLLIPSVAESVIGIKDPNTCGYWVITHKLNNNQYAVFHVTTTGISTPEYYNVGSNITQIAGQLAASPDGTKIAYSASSGSYLVDFNPSTGVISNERNLNQKSFSCAFSSNSRYLYMSYNGTYQVFQFDTEASDIPASKTVLGNIDDVVLIGNMQRGPNGKIYICHYRTTTLSYINNPDIGGTGCGFTLKGFNLSFGKSNMGLPNFCNQYDADCMLTSTSSATETSAEIHPTVVASSGRINIPSGSEGFSMFVYDLAGKPVAEIKDVNTEQLELSPYHLSPGCYMYQLYYISGRSASGKIMIQ